MAIQCTPQLLQAVKAYQAGDTSAFDTIYYESAPYLSACVLNVLQRTVGEVSEDLQQDILQDTYLTIAQKLWELNTPEAFLQWAGRIATHIAQRTWQKDARLRNQEVVGEEIVLEAMDEAFIPEDALMNREFQEKIRQLLKELPTNQYLCVVEYFYNDLKEREIADKLQMPLSTVKTNLSRAKQKLRGLIETRAQAAGVRYQDMAWLLLLLLRGDVLAITVPVSRSKQILAAVYTQLGIGTGAAVSAAAGGASASASASASAVAGAATKTAATKVAAIALAGTLTAGAAVGIPLATRDKAPEPTEPVTQPTEDPRKIPADAFQYGGHSYYLYRGGAEDWEAAHRFCESLGGHLAIVETPAENEALYGYLTASDGKSAYLGLYLDPASGQWKWVDGRTADYTNWAPGEPNNEGSDEAYGMFYYQFSNGTWNDGNFGRGTLNDDCFFLCEWED